MKNNHIKKGCLGRKKGFLQNINYSAVILCFFIFVTNVNENYSQLNNKVFKKIEGLSNPTVHAIMQDRKGFLWVGTETGLNRYDGYKFKIYKYVEGDSSTISSSCIRNVIEDGRGRIWVACKQGLSLYDRANDRFVRFYYDEKDNNSLIADDICCMFLDSRGILWIGTFKHGMCALDVNNSIDFCKTKPRFKQYRHDDSEYSLSSNFIRSFFEDRNHNIWVNAEINVLDFYVPATDNFRHYKLNLLEKVQEPDFVSIQYEDTDGTFWIATRGNGMVVWNRKNNSINSYIHKQGQNSIPPGQIKHIRKDKDGLFWISTDGGGISLFDRKTGLFQQCKAQLSDPGSLVTNAIYETFEDNTGLVWVGTFNGGLSKYDKYKTKFGLVRPNPTVKNGLNNKSVLALLEDKDQNLWVGTDGGGLNYFDKKTQQSIYYMKSGSSGNSLSSDVALSMALDENENIWIGTYGGGLDYFDRKKNRFIAYFNEPSNDNSLSSNDVWTLFYDSKKNLWISTIVGILNRFDPKTKQFTRYKQNLDDPYSFAEAFTNQIFEDSRHYLWLATTSGLEMVNLNETDFTNPSPKIKFKHFTHSPDNQNSLSSNNVFAICEDKSGNLWIGTDEGILNKYDIKANKFTAFSNGPKNCGIRAMVVDNQENIWLATINGLWKFSIKDSFFRKFDDSDGLQDMSFSKAFFKTRDGKIYFGGINGFNAFYPNDIPFNAVPPKTVITDFRVFNNSVRPNEKINDYIPLTDAIYNTKQITLPVWMNFITFEFAALDFTDPEKNKYLYQLEGFDNQWRYTDAENRTATYTNLDPGKYVFKVKASNNDGVWNTNECSIVLTILPPWWKTWWFKGLSVIFIISSMFAVYYVRIALYRSRQKELTQMVEQRSKELIQTNEKLIDRQARIEEYAEEVKVTNDQLLDRQARIEEQSEELKAQAIRLKEANNQLLEKQKLIEKQSVVLQDINDQLSILNSTKDRFFSIIAHDLRNPFNVVSGFSEILMRELKSLPTDKALKYIELIHSSSVNGSYLLENLLQWSRSQTGRISFDPMPQNLWSIVEENIALLFGEAQQKNIRILSQIDSKLSVLADSNMIKTILRNLISNAIKFTNQDGEIIISAKNERTQVVITVMDNGVGMTEEMSKMLFKVNTNISTKGTSNEGGTGLGLILCKEFVEKHGGKIWVESEEGKGSKFNFSLFKV